MRVLNVGGGPTRSMPSEYDGWEQSLLDIDPGVSPDILCDARDLASLDSGTFDAVYCSHNLEHFHQHDVPRVLAGMRHVLKAGGTVQIHVPNLIGLMTDMLSRRLDLNDVWYRCGAGPITFHDVLYGWSKQMAQGNLYYAHCCGFSELSLGQALSDAGFIDVGVVADSYNLCARASKCR